MGFAALYPSYMLLDEVADDLGIAKLVN